MKVYMLVLILTLVVANTTVQAQNKPSEEAEKAVLALYGGEILSSELDEFLGRNVYVIRVLLSDSTIRVFQVDADTGEIID